MPESHIAERRARLVALTNDELREAVMDVLDSRALLMDVLETYAEPTFIDNLLEGM